MNDPELDDLDDDLDDPLAAEDDSFEDATGTASGASDEFEDFDEDPVVFGLFRGHVAECKRNPKKPHQIILEIASEEAETRGAKATAFLDMSDARQKARFRAIAGHLGAKVGPQPGGKGWRLHGGLKSVKNLPGLFVCDTYKRDDGSVSSSLRWGLPKKGKNKEWDDWFAAQNFNENQVKALKASPGVINPKQVKLFE